MPVSAALSAGDLAALRANGHTVKRYLSGIPHTSVATARINQATFANPIAEITVDTTSGWSDVKAGMTVWIGTAAGLHDMGAFRVRKTPGASTLYVGEMSDGDSGILALSVLFPLADNSYVTVIKEYNIHSVFPRIVYAGAADVRAATFTKDWETAYGTQNETAIPPIVNITMTGDKTPGFVDPADSKLSVVGTAVVTTFTGSVSTYAWDIDGGTLTAGAVDSATVSVDYTVGSYWLSCTVTLDTGATHTARRWIRAHNLTSDLPTEIEVTSDSRDQYGRRMGIKVIDGFGTIDDGAMAVYWEDASWGGSDILSASTRFVGFARSVSGSSTAPGLTEQSIELVSPLEIAKDMVAFSQELTTVADAANWQEVVETYATINFWVWYLLHWHSTLLTLFDFHLVSVVDYVTMAWGVDRGDLFSQLQQAAQRVNCAVGQRSDGAIFIRRDPQLMTDTSAVVFRMTMTEADVVSINAEKLIRPRIGQVSGTGFDYISGELIGYQFNAPGFTGGQGAGVATLENQLIDNFIDLARRTYQEYARQNNPLPDIQIAIDANYDVFEPCERYFIMLTVASPYWIDGTSFGKGVIPKTVTITHEPNGSKRMVISCEAYVYSSAMMAEFVPFAALPDSTYNAGIIEGTSYVTIPPYDASTGLLAPTYDPFGQTTLSTAPAPMPEGTPALMLAWVAAALHVTTNATASSPLWTTLFAPAAESVIDVIHAPDSPYLSDITAALNYWGLTVAGLWYVTDGLGAAPTATFKQALTGYSLLRASAGDAGGIACYKQKLTGVWTKTIDLTAGNGGLTNNSPSNATYSAGVGWVHGDYLVASEPRKIRGMYLHLAFAAPTTITRLEITYTVTKGTVIAGNNHVQLSAGATSVFALLGTDETDGTHTRGGTGLSVTAAFLDIVLYASRALFSGGYSGAMTLTSIILDGTGFDPYTNVAASYSSNTGTAIDAFAVGTNGGDQGADLDDFNLGVHVITCDNGISYTTAYDGTGLATLAGLTGIDGTAAVSVVRVPYRKLATQALNNSATSLQFIYGTSTAVSGKTLWGVTFNSATGAIAAQSDMTPIISGTTYYIIGKQALATSGSDTRIIRAFAKPLAGGDTKLIGTDDGGTNWTIINSFDGDYVYWIDANTLAVSGADGIGYSRNRGITIAAKTGDFSGTALGVLVFDRY